jgi:hypothetical protein
MTAPPTVTISEEAAKVLLRVARQIQMPSGLGKIQIGTAQVELEMALNKLVEAKEGKTKEEEQIES